MLKKLVRYGNSNALVIDKAILELLNIGEGSVVKLSTDGKSIVITPQEVVQEEVVHEPLTSEDVNFKSIADQSFPNDKPGLELEKKKIQLISLLKKQHSLLESIHTNKEYVKDLAAARIECGADYAKLHAVNQELQNKHIPELTDVMNDIIELSGGKKEDADNMGAQFTEMFAKNQDLMAKFAKVVESPEYQHEKQLLVEKFEGNQNSKEFSEALNILNYKYCPEMKAMHQQLASKKNK